MTTELKEKVSIENLKKEAIVVSAPHTVTLSPKCSSSLEGRPGTTYQLIMINIDEELDATIYAFNGSDGSLERATVLSPISTTKSVFQMNSNGQIQVYNWSDSKFSPNPQVSFILRSIR